MLPLNAKGYNQTYIVRSADINADEQDTWACRETLFRCGNYCYEGIVKLSYQNAFEMTLKGPCVCIAKSIFINTLFLKSFFSDIPHLIPKIQQQQHNLSYSCKSPDIPVSSIYHGPIHAFEGAQDLLARELASDKIMSKITHLRKKNRWMENDSIYFELVGDASYLFPEILFICSKVYTYANELLYNIIYFEGTIYVTIEEMKGEQPLIDINFPDLSCGGQDAVLSLFGDEDLPWLKLSIWQLKPPRIWKEQTPPQHEQRDLSSDCYVQSYCILKSQDGGDERDVMFRYGSWCYSGRVELASTLSLDDLPALIPILRLQQSKLSFESDISKIVRSTFASALEYASMAASVMEVEAMSSENFIKSLICREGPKTHSHWLEDDKFTCVFEFSCTSNHILDNVEMIATKSFQPRYTATSIYHDGSFFLMLHENGNEQPLLDSNFPDLSIRTQRHLVQSYPSGLSSWSQLRKLSICCIKNSDSVISGNDLLGLPHIKNLSSRSNSISSIEDESDEPLLTNAIHSAMDVLDDAMLDICNMFDNAMGNCDRCDNQSEFDRAARMSALERKLEVMRSRIEAEETEDDRNGTSLITNIGL